MAGTYWLTVLPDASKLEKGIKDAVKKAGTDISRDTRGGLGPEVIMGDDSRWRDRARDVGRHIRDELKNSGAGDVLRDVLSEAGHEAGRTIGRTIGEAIGNSPVGDTLRGWRDALEPAVESAQKLGDALGKLKDRDAAGAMQDTSDALRSIGQSDAADVLSKINETTSTLTGHLKGATDGMHTFADSGNGLGGLLGKLTSIGNVAADVVAALEAIKTGDQYLEDKLPWYKTLDEQFKNNPLNSWARRTFGDDPKAPGAPAAPVPNPGVPLLPSLPGNVSAPAPTGGIDPFAPLDTGHAAGGLLRGAGTGKSDSILARVSNGEYITDAATTSKWLPLLRALPGFAGGGLVDDQINSLVGIPYGMGGFGTGSLDCSGLVSAVVNSYLGRPMFSSRMSTPSEGSWLSSLGARTGRGGAGDLTVLWWDGGTGGGANGHTEAILPNGQVIEATSGGVKIGSGTTPANASQWKQAMYIPKELLMGAMHPQSGGGASNAGAVGSLFGGGGGGGGASGGSGGSGGSLGGSLGGGGGGGGGGLGSVPDLGQIGSIASGGIKQTLGLDGSVFSDPTQWKDVKSAFAGAQFLGGLFGGMAQRHAQQNGDETLGQTAAGSLLSGLPFGNLLGSIPTGRKLPGGGGAAGGSPFGVLGLDGAPAGQRPGDPEFARNQQAAGQAASWADAVNRQQFQPPPSAAAQMPELATMFANIALPIAASALNDPGAFQGKPASSMNPFAAGGTNGPGGTQNDITRGMAAARYAPAPGQQGQPGNGQPGSGDYNVTINNKGDADGIQNRLRQDFTDRTRVVGPQG